MKRVIAYCFLIVYTLVQLRPVYSVVSDVIAHAFFKASHLATVHYENGTYHLHAELKKAAEDSKPGKNNAASSEKQETVSLHETSVKTEVPFSALQSCHKITTHGKEPLSGAFISIVSPPPEA